MSASLTKLPKTISTDKRGITLIEVLVTITILTAGILTLTRLFPLAMKISRSAEQATIATNLAQAKIEEMFYLGYDSIPTGEIESRGRMSTNPENPFYYYQRETESEHVDQNLNTSVSETGIKKITTVVYWQSAALGIEKNIELSVIISER